MRLFSEQLAAILEDLVKRLRIVPSQIDGQILGTQVQPAQNGVAGVVSLSQIPSVSGTTGEVAYFTAPDTITSEAQLSLTRGGTGSNLSATGPGLLQQSTTGGNVSAVATPEGRILFGATGGSGVTTTANIRWVDQLLVTQSAPINTVNSIASGAGGTAVSGVSNFPTGGGIGINGESSSQNGIGLSAQASGTGGRALRAAASGSATIAAEFIGSVDIDGALSLDDTGGTNHLLKQSTAGGVVTSGTLTDAEHGVRGGGTLHDVATTSIAGFLSAADKTKLDGIGAGASVSSVALAAPSILTVSGSPITTSGTITLALATQPANRVFAGPVSGADATPTFRALGKTDLPAAIAYEDEANTYTAAQAFSAHTAFAEIAAPSAPATNVTHLFAPTTASRYLPLATQQEATATADAMPSEIEGTFSPTFGGSTTDGTVNYAQQSGNWLRHGSMCHITIEIEVTATGFVAPTGNLRLKGLPFTSANREHSLTLGTIGVLDYPAGALEIQAYVLPSTTEIALVYSRDNLAALGVPATSLQTTTLMRLSGWYRVA